MTSPILFAGNEDLSFDPIGGNFVAGPAGFDPGIVLDTTPGRFRPLFARHALTVNSDNDVVNTTGFRSKKFTPSSQFWLTARVWCSPKDLFGAAANSFLLRILDAKLLPRIVITNEGGGPTIGSSNGPYQVSSAGAGGAGSVFFDTNGFHYFSSGFGDEPLIPDKLDLYINYDIDTATPPGQIIAYINGTQVYDSGAVDLTTNGNTTLAYVEFYNPMQALGNAFGYTSWSEIIVSTRDTRNMGLLTQVPAGNGNTHNWDFGNAGNMQSLFESDMVPDFSGTANQIDEYTVQPAPPVGNFGIVSVVQHARATAGTTGPTRIQQMVRTNATDYVSASKTLTGAWETYIENWDLNPHTTAEWKTSELPAASTNFNMGIKSIT